MPVTTLLGLEMADRTADLLSSASDLEAVNSFPFRLIGDEARARAPPGPIQIYPPLLHQFCRQPKLEMP
jgi:hypothetical protein